VRFHGERQVREPVEQRAQRDLAFHLRQGGTDAVVDAGRERQVLSGISPGDVEALRVREHGGVAVGTTEQCDGELAGPHVLTKRTSQLRWFSEYRVNGAAIPYVSPLADSDSSARYSRCSGNP
jgi:hypothetical protein